MATEEPQTDHEHEDPRIGQVIDGRFRLDSLLGAGGMGRVYRGTQLSIDRDVAIKLLRGEIVPDRKLRERFMREARVISGFSHPNIVRLIDFGEDAEDGLPYLVMELLGGIPLSDLLERGRLSPELALEITRQMCTGLLEAHGSGIIHRDLKPENIQLLRLSDGSLQVKLMDFGIAYPKDTGENLTDTGMVFGTAAYMAPEQAKSGEADSQTDLYSLGVILYHMLSGKPPFTGNSDFDIVVQHVQDSPPPLSEHLPGEELPAELAELVRRLMAKQPRARPPGARSVRTEVEALAEAFGDGPLELETSRPLDEAFEPHVLPVHTILGDPEQAESMGLEDTAAAEGFGPAEQGSAPVPAADPGSMPDENAGTPAPSPSPSDAPSGGTDAPSRRPRRRWLEVAAMFTGALFVVTAAVILGMWLADGNTSGATDGPNADRSPRPAGADTGGASTQSERAASSNDTGSAVAQADRDAGSADATPPETAVAAKETPQDEQNGEEPSVDGRATAEQGAGGSESTGAPDPDDGYDQGGRAAQTDDDPDDRTAEDDDKDDRPPRDDPPSAAAESDAPDRTANTKSTGSDDTPTPPAGNAKAQPAPTRGSDGFGLKPEWRRRRKDIFARCRQARRGIKENSRHYQELAAQKKYEKMREFARTMQAENKKYANQMDQVADDYGKLVEELAKAGVDGETLQKMGEAFGRACSDK